ncbi:MAG: VOC family protein [Phycisphaeraceae bacterium]|nr:VOC family protein [Phycisphaeraceae bacterium]
MKVSFPIVFVSDMSRSVAFYRDVLGLPLRFETPHWTEFGAESATLALHVSREPNPDPPGGTAEYAGRCRFGLHVPDLDAFHTKMLERGVVCLEPPAETFGARLALYADPDGLPISVGEASA